MVCFSVGWLYCSEFGNLEQLISDYYPGVSSSTYNIITTLCNFLLRHRLSTCCESPPRLYLRGLLNNSKHVWKVFFCPSCAICKLCKAVNVWLGISFARHYSNRCSFAEFRELCIGLYLSFIDFNVPARVPKWLASIFARDPLSSKGPLCTLLVEVLTSGINYIARWDFCQQ